MSGGCQAVVAEFAWFPAYCNALAVDTVTYDGETFHACEKHLAAYLDVMLAPSTAPRTASDAGSGSQPHGDAAGRSGGDEA